MYSRSQRNGEKNRLKHQLFIGKANEIIGFDKTLELLKQCNNEIK